MCRWSSTWASARTGTKRTRTLSKTGCTGILRQVLAPTCRRAQAHRRLPLVAQGQPLVSRCTRRSTRRASFRDRDSQRRLNHARTRPRRSPCHAAIADSPVRGGGQFRVQSRGGHAAVGGFLRQAQARAFARLFRRGGCDNRTHGFGGGAGLRVLAGRPPQRQRRRRASACFARWRAATSCGWPGSNSAVAATVTGARSSMRLFATTHGKKTWVVRIPRGSRYRAAVLHLLLPHGFTAVGDTTHMRWFLRDRCAADV